MNSIQLVGRLGCDPETQYFESGACKTKFSLAVNGERKDADPDWFEMVAWGKTAEIITTYLRRGSLIAVQGRFCQDKWTDKQSGEERTSDYVTVSAMRMLGSKGSEDSQ